MRDFTKGSISKHLIAFSVPMLIGSVFQQLYSMVDAIVVGNYVGSGALAAVGTSAPVLGFLLGVLMGLTTGASVLVSQYFGANEPEKLSRTVSTSIIFMVILIVVISLVGFIGTPTFLRLLSVPDDIFADSVIYLQVSFAGLLFLMFYNIYTSFLRALGDARNPLYILILSTVLNIGLDILFVAGFNWGVAGAAYATIISQAMAAVVCLIYAHKKVPALKISKLIFDRELFPQILKYSIPSAIQLSLTSLAGLTIQRLVNSFGSIAIAGYTAAIRIDGFALMPLSSISMATSTLVAQNMGAGREDRAKKTLHDSLLLMLGVGITISALAWIFGRDLIAMFISGTPEEINSILAVGTKYLSIIVSFYSLFAIFFAFNGFFRGVGDAVIVMILTIFSLSLRAVCAHIMVDVFAMGPEAVAWSIPIGWGLCSLIAWIYYKRRIWAGKIVIKVKEDS